MEDIIKKLKEVEEGFVGTTQAMSPFPTPVVGRETKDEDKEEDKKDKEKNKKLDESIDVCLGKILDIVSLDNTRSIDVDQSRGTEHHVVDMLPLEDGKEITMPMSTEEEKQCPPDMKEEEMKDRSLLK